MNVAASNMRSLDRERSHAKLFFCGFFILILVMGCRLVSKTPSRDLYNYKFMSKEWKTLVREIVADPERQDNIIESSRITGDGPTILKIESEEIRRAYLRTLACYECDLNAFEPVMKRIEAAEETATHTILDLLDVLRENTTKEELKLLIKRKLEP